MTDDETDDQRVDLHAIALRKLHNHPDKKIGLLWGDLCAMLEEGSHDSETSLTPHFVRLATQGLLYLDDLQSELRYRLEHLERVVGVVYQQDGAPFSFPSSGRQISLAEDGRDNLTNRIVHLENKVNLR